MSQTQLCSIHKCEQSSSVLCYCCNKNLCLDHLSNHRTLIDFQSYSLTDQIRILDEQLKKLNNNTLIHDACQKLEKWRDESMKKIEHFYEQKCEEVDRYFKQNIHQKQYEIEQLNKKQEHLYENDLKTFILDTKQRTDTIESKGIPINIRSLVINHHLITIGELKTEEFDLNTLSLPPSQTLDCSNKLGSALASNDQYLLMDENPFLTLYDSELNIIEQTSWKYGIIYDYVLVIDIR